MKQTLKRFTSLLLAVVMLIGLLPQMTLPAKAEAYTPIESVLSPLCQEITVHPGQLVGDTGEIVESDTYGHVVGYELKKGHILTISNTDYVFSVRQLVDGDYSTMLKQATTDSFTATEDMTVGLLIRKPDKSALTAEELKSIVIYDNQYGMIGVEGYAQRFTVEAETIDGATATTRANIFLPKSYIAGGEPTKLIVMTNGHSAYLTDSVWNGNTAENVGIIRNYLNAGYAVWVVNNTKNHTGKTPDLGCPQLVDSYLKAYEYIQKNFNVEQKFSIHSRSFGTFAAMRLMQEVPELIKCAVMTGPRVSIKKEWPGLDKAFIATRFGFVDTTGGTYEADKLVGYDPYTDVDGDNYALPPTFWMLCEGDATAKPLEVIEKLAAHGNNVNQKTYTGTTHTGVCTLNSEEMFADALAFLDRYQTLEGKTISILGASISTYAGTSNGAAADTTNSTIRNNAKYYPHSVVTDVELTDTWWMQVAEDLNLRLLVNNSWSGSSLLHERNGTVGAYVDRCVQLHDDTGDNAGEMPDIIGIQMGTNDFQYYKDTLGTADIDYDSLITDNGDNTYTYATPVTSLEAAAIVLHKISVRYPNAEVYYLNISQRVDGTDELIRSFNAELKQVVEHFGAHIVDIYNCGITMENFDTYIGDGRVHPNCLGMDAYTEAFKAALLAHTDYSVNTHTVSLDLTTATADYGTDKVVVDGDTFRVNLTTSVGNVLDVSVTMGGENITADCYAEGSVTIDAVTADVTITAKGIRVPQNYRWEFDGTDLASITTGINAENTLTKNAGTTADGVFDKTRYALESSVVLAHDKPWVVEWKCEGTWKNSGTSSGGRMFTSTDVNAEYNARYIFKSATNWILAMGEKTTTGSHNYGIALADHGIDGSEEHTYRLENRIADDGSNMVWLYVDGVEIGAMNNYYVGTTNKNTTSDWLSGKDFAFPYMGTDTHGLTNCSIDYIQVWEGGVPSLAGKTISILGDSISTFSGVSNNTVYNSTIGSNAVYYSGSNLGISQADTWWQQTIDALGMELLVNNSWSGSCILNTRSGTAGAYVDRCVQLHNDQTEEEPDVIAVFLGTNDFSYYQSTLGTANIDYAALVTENSDGNYTYATPTTSCEAYAIMLHKMTNRYPNAEIYCMTMTARRSPDKEDSYADVGQPTVFNESLTAIADRFGCTVVDLENCGIDKEAEVFDTYMGDGRVHPNAEGMDLITQTLVSAMLGKETKVYDVSTDLTGVTSDNDASVILGEEAYTAVLTGKGDTANMDVSVTMGGVDVTETVYSGGKITIRSVTGDITVTAVDNTPANYRWEFDGEALVSVSGDNSSENALTLQGGSVSGGILANAYYLMDEKVVLRHDRPWTVAVKASGSWSGMLFSAKKSAGTAGNVYLFKTTGTNGFMGFGERVNSQYQNYGIALGSQGVDTTLEHTYCMENRIAADGSNMVYLLVDGVDYGAMNHYFIGGSTDQGTTVDWLNGKDLIFSYIGASGHAMNNCALDYIQVWEGGEPAKPLPLRYDDHYDVAGKTVEIVDVGKPTSYQVGYGVEENAVLDTAVVTLKGNTLVATGIGAAKVRIDGQLYEVTVEAAPISLLLLIGQSNMRGSEGNADQSIVCPDGMVYATFGDDRGDEEGIMNVDNATQFAASALTGEYSTINVEGTIDHLSYYPLNSLTADGNGTFGPDSGFAYEWIKQTGEKVWVVNAAHGGSSIKSWVESATNFKECDLLFSACQETLRKEIAAGHFTLSHMGYFWCQGCSDYSWTAEEYVTKYLAMHESLKKELSFDHDSNATTAEKTLEFAGIIPVRAGHDYNDGYREDVYTDSTDNRFYESFKDLQMTGPRVAQYWMCNNPELEDIWMVCNIGEDWVWMPDGTNGVAEYFQAHYEDGTVDYTTQVQQSASWYTPTTPAAVHDSIHYNQIGYNEVGRESVRNALIMLGEIEAPDEDTMVEWLSWDGYNAKKSVTAATSGTSGTLVVPKVYPVWETKKVTYTLSDGLIWDYYDLLASNDTIDGTLSSDITANTIEVIGHNWSEWEAVSVPSAEGPGQQRRVCADCGMVDTKTVDGVWQIYDLNDHLLELPENVCCNTNLWELLPHEDVHFTSGKKWGSTSTPVTSITIPVNAGDRLYATSWNKAGENGHATSDGIRLTFFDANGIVLTLGPGESYRKFAANGGYLEAPEGSIAINIAMWYDSEDYEVYILNREHSYSGINCTICGEGHPKAVDYAGKVISVLGDSISTFDGYIPVADGFNLEHVARYPQDNLLTDVNETWWMQVIAELDAKLGINDSWRSTEVYNYIDAEVNGSYDGTKACMASTTRIQNLGSNGTPDLILFYGGTNDITQRRNIGTFDTETAPTEVDLTSEKWDTVADAYVAAIMRMQHYYPNAKIIAMLPTFTYKNTDEVIEEYNSVFAAICKHYGVTYIDLRDCGITTANLPDGTHPNAQGMDYITEAVLGILLEDGEIQAGEHIVHSVKHNLSGAESSLGYYKGISDGAPFVAAITGEDVEVVVTMGGVDITDVAYANGIVTIECVTDDLIITAVGRKKTVYEDYLQQLPESICSALNLWTELEPINLYYTATGWGINATGAAHSVTIPISAGDQIWATSFQKAGTNGGNGDGIRLTWFDVDGVLKALSPSATYSEFVANGYVTAPEGAVAVNVVMWNGDESNELYILNREHSYSGINCTICGAQHPALANWSGKVISILSASTSTFEGYIPVADGFNLTHRTRYPDTSRVPDVTSVDQTWWMQLITSLDAKLGINDSWAGSQVLNTLDANSGDLGPDAAMASMTRIQNLGANGNPDVILFFGAGNDMGRGVPLGSFDPATAPTTVDLTTTKWETLADAYVATIMRLQHAYPDAQIVAVTTYAMPSYATAAKLDKYIPVLKAICDHYGVPTVDLRDSGVTFDMLPDNIHPNAEGMDLITEAVLNKLLNDIPVESGENVVYSVSHELNNAVASLGYYKGVSVGEAFTEILTGNDLTATVTMGGVDITADVYMDGKVAIPEVTGDIVITARAAFNADGHLQQLPEEICSGTNLWTALEPENIYYTATGWGNTAAGTTWSVTFPVKAGDRIWATSLGAYPGNGSTANGVRVTWFDENGVLETVSRDVVYSEFSANGYLTAPEGAVALNLPMTGNEPNYAIYLLDRAHNYESAVTAPTCTEQGYTTYTCHCGDSYVDDYVDATGHGYGEWYEVDKPTCTTAGEDRRDCGNCDHYETREVEALGHDFTQHEAKEPTCTAVGWEAYETCSRCDYSTYEEIPATGHNHAAEVTLPTCTEQGYTTYTCHCGDSYVDDYVDATGHGYGEWYEVDKPTCTTAGEDRRDCDNCDHYETREVEALGHDFTQHEAKEPTCTAIGWEAYETCSRCDYTTYAKIPATGHNHVAEVTPPTCTEQGYTTYTCHCGNSYVDDYVDASGHSYGEWYELNAPTCTTAGEDRRDCDNCDHYETRVIDAVGHDLTQHGAKEPTCTAVGWEAYETCSCCAHTTYTEIPAIGHSFTNYISDDNATTSEDGTKTAHCDRMGCTETDTVIEQGSKLTVVSLVITCHPAKVLYIEGEDISVDGMIVTAIYSNDTIQNITGYMLSGYDKTELGVQEITVSYGGCSASFTVTVCPNVPSRITSALYKVLDGFIRKIPLGSTARELLEGVNETIYVKLYSESVEVPDTTVVGTGMIMSLMDGDTIKDSVTVVVTGDSNGDGKLTITDMLAVKAHLLNKSTLIGAYAEASDTNGDEKITITDFIQMKAHVLGKSSVAEN